MAGSFVTTSTQTIAFSGTSTATRAVNAVTLMGWAYAISLPGTWNSIVGFSNGVDGTRTRCKLGVLAGGEIRGNGRCADADSNREILSAAGTVGTGSWNHLVAVFNYSAATIAVYKNGALSNSGSVVWTAAPTSNTTSLQYNIGAQHGGGSEYWNGYLDDIRVYARALSLAEIQTIYAARGKDTILSNLRHRYVFMEGAPGTTISTLIDIAELRVNGTSSGSPIYYQSELTFKRGLYGRM